MNLPDGQPVFIQGLNGLAFGAGGGTAGDANTLYFTTNLTLGQHGVFGGISVNPGTAPQIASVVIGDGTAQRSMVTQLEVTFDHHVVLPQKAADAFRLNRQGDGAAMNLAADVNDLGGGTVVILTFAGGAVEQSQLANPLWPTAVTH